MNVSSNLAIAITIVINIKSVLLLVTKNIVRKQMKLLFTGSKIKTSKINHFFRLIELIVDCNCRLTACEKGSGGKINYFFVD